jgi:transposase
MFIKKTRGGSKDKPISYLQLAQSYRDKDGKPKHRVLCTLGREDDIINSGLTDSLAEKFASLTDNFILINKQKQCLGSSFLLGPILALEALWKKLNFKGLFQTLGSQYNLSIDFEKAVKLMVLNRLVDPKSKLAIQDWKNKLYGQEFQSIELHHLYKSIDILAKNKNILQKELYKTTLSLFKPEIKLVFYDLTTFYFESQIPAVLKKFGYSKDNKTDCVQIMLGLIISQDDIPLGYELFPGNTYEGNTVKTMIERLKEKYKIEKIVFVADKGILSEKVLLELETAGYEYIVSYKIAAMPKKDHERILDKQDYTKVNEDLQTKEIQHKGRRLILGHSQKRAGRDRHMREELLKKLEKIIAKDKKSIIANSAQKKYLNITGCTVNIDNQKVEKQSQWDGYFGFITNNQEMKSQEILHAYRLLWQIEESFRCMKSTLDLRPVYHWTERRIEGHIMLCFLSFYVLRVMQRQWISSGIDLSPAKVMENLSEIRAIELKTDKQSIYARTEIVGLNNQIFRALGVKIPNFIL